MYRLWFALLLVFSLTPSHGAASEAPYAAGTGTPEMELREWKPPNGIKANLVAGRVVPRFDGPSRVPLILPAALLPRQAFHVDQLGLVAREPSVHGIDAVPPLL